MRSRFSGGASQWWRSPCQSASAGAEQGAPPDRGHEAVRADARDNVPAAAGERAAFGWQAEPAVTKELTSAARNPTAVRGADREGQDYGIVTPCAYLAFALIADHFASYERTFLPVSLISFVVGGFVAGFAYAVVTRDGLHHARPRTRRA